jgi:hypothetical protein
LVFLVDDAEFRIDAVPADENESHSSKNLNRLKKYIELNMFTKNKNPPNAVFPWFPFEVLQSYKAKCEPDKSSSKMSCVADLSQTLIHVF